MSLVFYDTETTGTRTFFDQILQFAAIKTDEDLNEIERFEIRCRLMPHVVPAPNAMRVNKVRASQLTDAAYPSHYEMVCALASKLNLWSPSLFLGWNSLRFDEDLVRQALYKTLHDPYLTNTSGNSRSDVMRIVQACSLFAPDALVIPTGTVGQLVYKLDHVAPANGFKHDAAHDAMGDVQATLFLCRLLIERAPQVWSSFMRFSKKASVIDYIKEESVFCLSDFYYGRPFSGIYTALDSNPENGGEYYVYDLNTDPKFLCGIADKELAALVAATPKLVRTLKCNTAPMIFPADEAPNCCRSRDLGMDELCRRAEVLKADANLRAALMRAAQSQREVFPESPNVEEQIYKGFFGTTDKQLMIAFHKAAWPKRPAIVDKFQDQRLRKIGRRLIYLEHPDLLDSNTQKEFDREMARRVLGQGENNSWLTIPEALLEIEAMKQGLSGDELEHICEHEIYLSARQAKALAYLGS
jgi:exodeoxyribonuclease-1